MPGPLVLAIVVDDEQAVSSLSEQLPAASKKFQVAYEDMAARNVASTDAQIRKLLELQAVLKETSVGSVIGTGAGAKNTVAVSQAAVRAELAKTEKQLAALGIASTVPLSKSLDTVGMKAMSLGKSMSMWLTAPFVLAAAESTKMFINFQRQMEMIHTQAGAPQAEVAFQDKQLLDYAASGKSAVSPVDLAKGLFFTESRGFRGLTATDITKIASEAAGMGQAPMEDVSNALGGASLAYLGKNAQPTLKQIDQTMGIINATVGGGAMHMADYANALRTGVAPAAHDAGITLQELGAALDVMTDRGMPAQMAATRLRMTIAMMEKPTQAAQKALYDLGIGEYQLKDLLSSGPTGMLKALELLQAARDKMAAARGKAGADQATGDILEIFGKGRSSAGILTLLNSLDSGTSSFQSKLAQIDRAQKNFNQDWVAYTHTTQYQLESSWHAIQADMIKLGGDMAPAVRDIAHAAKDLVNGFTALPGPVKEGIGVVALLAAGLGPVLLTVGLITKGAKDFADGWRAASNIVNAVSSRMQSSMAAVRGEAQKTNQTVGADRVTAEETGAAGDEAANAKIAASEKASKTEATTTNTALGAGRKTAAAEGAAGVETADTTIQTSTKTTTTEVDTLNTSLGVKGVGKAATEGATIAVTEEEAIGTAAVTTTTEVSALQKGLIALGGSAVMGALGGLLTKLGFIAAATFSIGDGLAASHNKGPATIVTPQGTFTRQNYGSGGSSYLGPNGHLWLRDPSGRMVDTGIVAPGTTSDAITPGMPSLPGGLGSAFLNVGGGAGTKKMSVLDGQNYVLAQLKARGFSDSQLGMIRNLMNYEDGNGAPGDVINGIATSFGPTQLHGIVEGVGSAGQLPQSIAALGPAAAQRWAWSKAGLNYLVGHLSQFQGLSGSQLAQALAQSQGSTDIPKEFRAILGFGGSNFYDGPITSANNPMASQVGTQHNSEAEAAAKKAAAAAKKAGEAAAKAIIDPITADIEKFKAQIAADKSSSDGTAQAYTKLISKYRKSKEALQDDIEQVTKEISGTKNTTEIARLNAEKAKLKDALTRLDGELTKAMDERALVLLKPLFTTDNQQYTTFTKKYEALAKLQGYQIPKVGGGMTTDTTPAIIDALNSEATTLQTEQTTLKTKLQTATGKAKTAIKSELARIGTNIDSVNNDIESALKTNVQNLTQSYSTAVSNFGTAFNQLVQDIDQAFQNETQDYIDNVLQVQYYQSGRLTPAEAALQAFQTQKTNEQLAFDLQKARTRLAQDIGTGASLDTIQQDQQDIQNAQDAITANKLQLAATASRTKADQQYAAAEKQWTDDRSVLEKKMNDDLAALATGIEQNDPTHNLGQLDTITGTYGVHMDKTDKQLYGIDFPKVQAALTGPNGLASATDAVQKAFQALVDWVNKTTGSNITTKSKNGRGPDTSTKSIGNVPPHLAAGGIVRGGYGGTLAMIGEGVHDELVAPLDSLRGMGGGHGHEVHVHIGTVIGTSLEQAARELEPHISSALYKRQKFNAGASYQQIG